MILLRGTRGQEGAEHLVAVFGVGLIGRAIVRAFAPHATQPASHLPLAWTDESQQKTDLDRLQATIEGILGRCPDADFTAIWSAGRAGFSATRDDTASELESFHRVLELSEQVASSFPAHRPFFVFFGSAGGLFEGQRLVRAASRPRPRRPYGELKLQQEELLRNSAARMTRKIVRLTSVFGCIRPGQRRGLIPTLVSNGLRQRVTSIVGRDTTLRDYLWVEDVARFALEEIFSSNREAATETVLLASGRPASLLEIKEIVQRTQKRKVYISYRSDLSNEEDITISPSLLPPNWHPTDLGSSIRRVHSDALTHGVLFSPSA